MKFNLSHKQLKEAERSVYSQAGQDGVIEIIFKQIGDGSKYAIEFGAGNGVHLSNVYNLLENHFWTITQLDKEPLSSTVDKAEINAENVNEIFFGVREPDYVSIDCDGNDFWIWQAMKLTPRIVSIEYNSKFRNDESYAIEYNHEHIWQGDDYYGASLLALKRLGERKGYTLVHIVEQLDAFFVRNDLLDESYAPPNIEELLPEPIIAHEKVSNKKWVEI